MAVAPPSSSSIDEMCVGVSAVNRSPRRGPISMVRSRTNVEANPATRRTGPSSDTIAVT